ncbi:MAG: peptidoglycan DD-metalloendopeptidase family protein [Clostridia bacterium]|nr:peptidoglycan DD-metalloendopeptidase family protein [Clostridia bacterium]
MRFKFIKKNTVSSSRRGAAVEGWLSAICTAVYRYHYGVGIHTMRLMRRYMRRVWRLIAPLVLYLTRLWRRFVLLPARRMMRRFARMFAAFPGAYREIRAAARQNGRAVFACIGDLCRRAVRRYQDELRILWGFFGPVVAAVVLVVTIVAWTGTDFCLALEYRGQPLGLIASETSYAAASAMAQERVMNEDDSFSVESVPQMALKVQGRKTVMTDAQLCDAILRTAGDAISEATGLYVNGDFVGAMSARGELESVLDGIKDTYYDKSNKNQRAEFVQDVELVDGLFPTSTVSGASVLHNDLVRETVVKKTYTVQAGDTLSTIARKHDMTTSELRALNTAYANTDMVHIGDVLTVRRPQSFLQVKVIKTIEYTEQIDYQTQTIYNDKMYVTESKVKTKGREGSQVVKAEITYVDGVESGRAVLSRTVTKQPVTRVVERGTKKVTSQSGGTVVQGDGVTTGSMLWPVPSCHNMSRGYFRGHYALDIANGPVTVRNKPAVAADGGTVVYAGWYYDYGYYVKIRHSNGLYTTYAHLMSISVVKGQSVSRGQQVGRIGSTGNSTGPHLHFEVIKNGVRVNPLNYVRP